ncbi:MAG: WYL domain-containing protein [Moraxellaceae bacterium]|nr:WYL domain-containing protein [Moraxellaceae bacterium]
MSGKIDSSDTLLRQWEMLRLIPQSAYRITTGELVSRLESLGYPVTQRTVQRDLQKLSVNFPISCDEGSTRPGWFWMEKASLDIPNLSISDALSIKMMENYLTPLLPTAILDSLRGRFDLAEKRLESVNNPLTRWTDKIRTVTPGQPLQAPAIAPDVLSVIQSALVNERQIAARYQGRSGKPATDFTLHPLALVLRGPISYLVARAFEYEDVRLYAMHRFEAATETEDRIVVPPNFDIDDFIATGALNFGSGETIALTLRVSLALKTTLMESPLSADMTLTEDGDRFRVHAEVPNTWQLRWWIQSQGPDVEVLEPDTLRHQIMASVQETLALYKV